MPVFLGRAHDGEPVRQAHIPVPLLPQPFVHPLLPHKLVEPVVRVVVADGEELADVVGDSGQPIRYGRVFAHRGLPAVRAVDADGRTPVHARNAQLIELFQRQQGTRQFDRTGRIEIILGIDAVLVPGKMRPVVGVAVDLRVENLHFVLGCGREHGRADGIGAQQGFEQGSSVSADSSRIDEGRKGRDDRVDSIFRHVRSRVKTLRIGAFAPKGRGLFFIGAVAGARFGQWSR